MAVGPGARHAPACLILRIFRTDGVQWPIGTRSHRFVNRRGVDDSSPPQGVAIHGCAEPALGCGHAAAAGSGHAHPRSARRGGLVRAVDVAGRRAARCRAAVHRAVHGLQRGPPRRGSRRAGWGGGRARGWRRALRRCRWSTGRCCRSTTAGGVLSSYEPVSSGLARGDPVARGQPFGAVLAGHCSVGCVHIGVRIDGQYVSPMRFLGVIPRAVLLPTRPLPSGAGMGQSVGLLELLAGDMGVELRGAEARVTEHLLHGAEIGSTVEEVRCRGVPEGVRA